MNYVATVTRTAQEIMTLCKIVTRYIVLINGLVIAWCSRSQKTVTLSVTETRYSEIAEVCCEILFVCAISLLVGFLNKYPITLNVGNIVAILLSENTPLSKRINHMDLHHHFI